MHFLQRRSVSAGRINGAGHTTVIPSQIESLPGGGFVFRIKENWWLDCSSCRLRPGLSNAQNL
jgi:hypothetical protein